MISYLLTIKSMFACWLVFHRLFSQLWGYRLFCIFTMLTLLPLYLLLLGLLLFYRKILIVIEPLTDLYVQCTWHT